MRSDRKAVFGWVMFDFANSAYTTLVVTFVYSTYFVSAIAPDKISGTVLWSRGITITALCVAFLAPVLGALADRCKQRKRYLFFSTLVTLGGTIMLNFVLPGQVYSALTWFVISNIAFELTNVFYNAFLPDISGRDTIGWISGVGWSAGYLGGLGAMLLALTGFISPQVPWFGLSQENGAHIRATCLLTAAWFAVFSIPLFVLVPSSPERGSKAGRVRGGWEDLRSTLGEITQYREILKLLAARMIYNDGLVTIFAFGGIFAAGTFGFSFTEIMVFGIVLNLAAGAGALMMGKLDDRLGGKRVIQISNLVLALAVFLAAVSPNRLWFWAAGVLVGLFAGPNQSASRSLLARFVPEEKENQFFGLFAFSGKLTAFAGPLLLGIFTQILESQRAGIFVVILFFLIGGLILARVDERAGYAAAARKD